MTARSDWYAQSGNEVLKSLSVDDTVGLTQATVDTRLKDWGANNLPVQKKPGFFFRILQQLHNPLFYLLEAASLVTFLLGDYIDAAVILSMVIINVIIGFIQEGKASKALESLHSMLSIKAVVLRESKRQEIEAAQLVPGDIVFLKLGSWVPADLRLLTAEKLSINESALTGESNPAKKITQVLEPNTVLADRHNMAYAGTVVTSGMAQGVVVSTGASTKIGQIQALMNETQVLSTPLSRRLDQFAKQISIFIVLTGILTFTYGYFFREFETLDLFLAVVGLTVASIPEGLPAIVIIVLTIGTRFMVRHNVIIRRLPAVESLGSVTVICSDKTGTLTKNEMTVVELKLPCEKLRVSGIGYEAKGDFYNENNNQKVAPNEALTDLARCALLCNDAYFKTDTVLGTQLIGDPTEGALLALAQKVGLSIEQIKTTFARIDVLPFESENRFMATLNQDDKGQAGIYLKGAPEVVFEVCAQTQETPFDRAAWEADMQLMLKASYRVLALGFKPTNIKTLSACDISSGFTLLGLVALIDPPREEAIKAVEECQQAGLKIKMVTGDHKGTATAIALKLGIKSEDVIARASPYDKLKLVQSLQAQGELVAVTGDGVNDAPALRAADIGVAMGKRGTDAAREAADLVLTDDNFATIVYAIKEGRIVYDNIKKSLLFILPMCASEAGVILLSILLGLELPITVGQVLWVNLVVEMTLGFTLAFEGAEHNVMLRAPRKPSEPLITLLSGMRILYVSFLLILSTFIIFQWELARENTLAMARTAAINMLVFGGLAYLFNVRRFRDTAFYKDLISENKMILYMSAVLILLQLTLTYTPMLQAIFQTQALGWQSWVLIFTLAVGLFLSVELEKAFLRYFKIQQI